MSMNAESYMHAVRTIAARHSPSEAAHMLRTALMQRGRQKLMARIVRALIREQERVEAAVPTVVVAKASDAPRAKKESGLHAPRVVVDATIIGGWRAYTQNTLTDASFKSHLKDIYNRVRT